jgi:beta-galactosidase
MRLGRHFAISALALSAAIFCSHTSAEGLLKVDAAKSAPAEVESGYFHMGTSLSPDGHALGINNRYLTLDGQPWTPVMGEFHYTRFPSDRWEEQIVKMKSAGVEILATYVIWAHHEPKSGEFNWSGDRDLKQFVELCAKHNMKVLLRIGPWAHGEVRYGGTPEWVVNEMPSRRNDPMYMTYVSRYWSQISQQIKGQYFKDGGPIIGIQLENEYNLVGPGMGIEHIETLKKLALSLGMDVPLYTVTGWDGTTYPKGEVAPVFGGYLDEPWGLGTTKMAPNEVYNFRFNSRVAGNAGAQTPGVTKGTAVEDIPHTPFLGAEYAGGLPIMYRRRPLVSTDDIGAMLPVQLGSGVNLYGYYMFQGGRNPGLNLEENALLGGYNDVPVINYDFQAPYGQYGQANPVLGTIRPYHLFLQAFGNRLAPMVVHAPETEPTSRSDFSTARFSVRSNGDSGFVFLSNYVRQYAMAPQKNVQFSVTLPSETLTFPESPITIPTGAYFIWPINFDLDGINLAWATAQPVTRLETAPGKVTYVFMAQDGIQPEFAISPQTDLKLKGPHRFKVGALDVFRPAPSRTVSLTANTKATTVSILVLSKADISKLWQGDVAGKQRLVMSSDDISFADNGLELRSLGDNRFDVGFYPALDATPKASIKMTSVGTDGAFQVYGATASPKTISVDFKKIRDEGEAPPVKIGGAADRALQPYPEAFGRSAAWSISVPSDSLQNVNDAFLEITYQGDVARLFTGTQLIDDQFFYGPTWSIGLKRFETMLGSPFTLTVMPLRKDAPIYLDDSVRADLPKTDQVARVTGVKVVPQYQMKISY